MVLTPALERDDGWLLYAARVPAAEPGEPATLLAWSGELPGNCKFARGAARAELFVQAELPRAVESFDRDAWVRGGFAAAAARLGLRGAPAPVECAPSGARPPELAALCRETGWPFDERADASVAVDLGVPETYLAARIGLRGEAIALEAELAAAPDARGPCLDALALLLLSTNRAFRMARAVLREPGPRALLEVRLPRDADASELGHALAALAVAAQRCAREARALAADAALAAAYLESSRIGRSGAVPLGRWT